MIPKYRMWLKCAGLMQRVHSINFYQETAEWIFHDLVNQKEVIEEELFENIILMQSTGLHDKNGKEIFEGDVVECYTDGLSVVEFVEGVFGLRCNGYFEGFNLVNGQFVVIGNIHEHSGLLKENGE